ncbi:MAG: DNA gyrase subunit A [Candidatus Dadabacteria bacterium]|nr:MAG: DNA gyrase subunit A [Candidatus Dadabacteria bacterium]
MEAEEKVSTVVLEEEMKQSYMDYAMSVIIGRALPDVRDGLKPVQRRILYAMMKEGLLHDKKHSKCAGVVGEVLKHYHPHGDSAVYDALVRMAQDWSMRYPLVDGQGNFGSIDGDPAAAYRYTECRLTEIAERLLDDITKDTVDFVPNFDGSIEEPTVLPTRIPNLLINGADGIAVGMATHVPPHNLREIIDGCIAYVKNPSITIDELMQFIPAPDFPTGGIIYGKESIKQAYSTGKGIIQLRAKVEQETLKSGNKEVEALIIKEVPFQVNKSQLVEKIAHLVSEKSIEGISKIRDESSREGIRVVLELKRDTSIEITLNQLYKLTPMQSSFGIILLAIVEGKPVVCTLKDLIKHFINHRRDVVMRRTQFELNNALERMHILDGFKVVLLNLDEVIQMIKSSQTPAEAKSRLIERFQLSDKQAQAVLDLKLQRLTGMERLAIEKEHQELAKTIEELKSILASQEKINNIIIKELEEIKEKFGDDRRTLIEDKKVDFNIEDLIHDEPMVVTITRRGYIKRTPVESYRAQKRGGKGVAGTKNSEDDFVQQLFVASTVSYLMVFTSAGKVYWLKVYQIPEGGRTARGRSLANLLSLSAEETITAVLSVKEFQEGRYVVMATKGGLVKKTSLTAFSHPRKKGIRAISLREDDYLVDVGISNGSDDIILATRSGMVIRFSEQDIRSMGRTGQGVRGIKFKRENDCVVGMIIVSTSERKDEEAGGASAFQDATMLTVCENGYGKRTELQKYRKQSRGGIGIIDIKTTERNGDVVDIAAVTKDSSVMLITSGGKVIRTYAKDIPVIGRNTQGVRLIAVEEGEKVMAIAPLVSED